MVGDTKMIKKILEIIKLKFYSPEKYARSIGVKIGDGCYISTKKFSSEPYLISIGNNVRIATGVSFFTHGAIWPFRKKYPDLDYFGKIKIGDNCYIGQDVKILPGVVIEDNCIIGAGTVLTKSVSNGQIVGGNPAKLIGMTEDFLSKVNRYNVGTKGLNEKKKKDVLLSLSDNEFISKGFI